MGNGRKKPDSEGPPIANRGRSQAVTSRPSFLSSLPNRGRSNAVSGNASDHFRQVGFAKTAAEKTITASSREKIHSALESGLQKTHLNSQTREEKTHALAYKQANNSNQIQRAINTVKGKLTPNVDTKEANRIAGKIDSKISGRIKEQNKDAWRHETNAGRLGTAATVASAAGTVANVSAGLTGGASLAVSAGASLASAGLHEAAARQSGKASKAYSQNADTKGKERLNLLDSYISGAKSGEQEIEKKKHRVAAAMGLVSGATGAGLQSAGVAGQQLFDTGSKDLLSSGSPRFGSKPDLSTPEGLTKAVDQKIKKPFNISERLRNSKLANFFNKGAKTANTVGSAATVGGMLADKAAASAMNDNARGSRVSAGSNEKNNLRGLHSEIAKTQVKQAELSRGQVKLKESSDISGLSASAKRVNIASHKNTGKNK